jgi:bacterial/archaeal transporter family-2 protein
MSNDDVFCKWYVGGLLVVIGGIAIATQGGVNSRVARTAGSNPAFSALQSFFVGTLCCFVFTLIWSRGLQGIDVKLAFQEGPWWQWMGGFLGTVQLVVNILAIPRFGAGTVSGILVCSLVIFSCIIDQFALVGVMQRDLTLWRGLGVIGLVGSVAIITFF